MNWIEEILIICGISLDIFGVMTCKGAVMARLEPKRMAGLCSLVALWQAGALALGAFLSDLLQTQRNIGHGTFLGQVLAAVIFFGLALRLLRKAWKNEWVTERREDRLDWKQMVRKLAVTGLYTLLAGVAFGFMGFQMKVILLMMLCASIVVVLLGIYSGYRLGSLHKLQAYAAGAALLGLAGADVVLRMVL